MSDGLTLVLETATARGSVALLRSARVVASRDVALNNRSRDELLPAVDACCEEAAVRPHDLTRIVCGAGPGSFTSLRIGASLAKGIAISVGSPIYAISSLLLTVAAASATLPHGLYMSVLDAYREEFFALLVEVAGDCRARPIGSWFLVRSDDLVDAARTRGARVIGPGAEIEAAPHAAGVAVVLPQLLLGEPVSLAAWEPDYGRAPEAQVRWEAAHDQPLRV